MGSDNALVQLRGLGKHFGEGATRVDALAGVDLDVHVGEVVGLLGPSGSGKSTLLNLVGCILEPTAGVMRLDGEEIWNGEWKRKDLRRFRLEKIGFIFQFHNLLPFLNAWENVAIVRTLLGDKPAAAQRRAFELLDYLKMSHRLSAMPAQLSGGEAQRVAIARALANESRIILADEPTAALDSERALAVIKLLRTAARERHAAVLVVTHDDKIFDCLDKKVHLRDGRIDPTP